MLMRPSLNNRLFLNRVVSSDLVKTSFCTSHTSSKQVPAVKNDEEHYEKQLKVFQTLTNVTKKVRTKKPQKPPFVKNFLLGKFDTDILTYAELNKEDTKNLEANVKLLKNLMKQDHMSQSTSLSKKFRQNLSDFKAIGLQAPQLMDGIECNITESCTFLEALSESNLRNSIVNNEQFGVQIINKFANEQLKIKYLTELMNGKKLSAMCISESKALDITSFKTKAKLSSDGKSWILNGEKSYVVNGKSADFLVVFAVSKIIIKDIIKEIKLSAFLVDKNLPGITITEIDTKGIEMVNIVFSDTPIPSENVIGELHNGQKLLTSLITESRLSVAPMGITVTKNIINNLINEIRSKSDERNMLHDTDGVKENIGQMSAALYGMESAAYLTTGLIDNYTDQDIEAESIISKVFSSEQTMKCAISTMNMIGLSGLAESHWLKPLFEEAVRFKTLNEPDEGLKIILALLCLQHAGPDMNNLVSKIRNPLFHGGFTFRRMWTNRRNNEDNPKLDLELGDYLHPSLENTSKLLEYCVKRLEFAAEIMLARYGPEVVNYHMDLKRLGDSIIDTYVMAACIARASRSYCIGLQNGDIEVTLAMSFCNQAVERVKYNINKLYLGVYHTNDQNYREIAKKVFKFKEYFPKHPLTRNF